MTDKERIRKEDPSRTKPLRDFSKLFDQAFNESSTDSNGTRKGKSYGNTVTDGVSLGYKVIEEQIRQGQRVAKDINSRSYGLNAMGGDAQELAERMVSFYSELVSLSVGLFGVISKNGLGSTTNSGQSSSASTTSADTGIRFSVKTNANTPATIALNLQTEQGNPSIHDLRDPDSTKPPITNIEFGRTDDGAWRISIDIPKGHPPGIYNGVVIDKGTASPIGTLSLCLE